MSGSLLQTKFYIPPQRPNLILRPQLLAKLNAGLGNGREFPHRLTLVSAPAGFGKTTLITNWLSQLGQAENGTGHLAPLQPCWLSLDENDNDLRRFIIYLIGAVQQTEAQDTEPFGADLLAALDSPRPPDESAVLPPLLNELAARQHPLLIVLDDYHAITTTAIHDWLSQLIDYLPPQVQLVMTSREDPPLPLARWRVRGQLTEIRAADLRFSTNETADFLHQTMGLSLDDTIIDQLENRTEGWVAGLQLAAIAIQSPQSFENTAIDTLVADFSGSERHVAGYLLEEVLHRQPPARQQFLLETAVLERFNAAICNHLTGRDDSHDMLDSLHQHNLFIIPLDNHGDWYRYHHLFAQLLRHRLARAETAEQQAARHRKARQWFQKQGLIEEAIYHSLQAGDAAWVADYLCQFAPIQFWEGATATAFKGWVRQLPPAMIEANPRLSLLFIWASLITTDVQGVEELLVKVVSTPNLDETLQAEVYMVQAIFARNQGASEHALTLVAKAMKNLPEEAETFRMIGFMQLVSAGLNLGRLNEAYDYARYVYDAVDTETTTGQNLFVGAAQLLSIILRNKGQVYEAFQLTNHSIEVIKSRAEGFFPMIGLLYSEFGSIYYEWNELDEVREYCRLTIELGERTGISDLLFSSYFLDTRLARQEGDLNRLSERLKWFKEITRHTKMDEMIRTAHYLEAAFRLEVGDLTSAVRWANGSGLYLSDKPTYEHYGQYHTLARIYLAESQHQPQGRASILEQVGGLIDRLDTMILPTNDILALVEVAILKAIQLKMQGQIAAATAEMKRAIIHAEPGTMIRTFLDNGPIVYSLIQEVALAGNNNAEHAAYIQRLLRACEAEWDFSGTLPNQHTAGLIQPPAEPLTEREREVLACITAGLSNREIEERLVISRNTVRTHIKNLYSKLGVNGRDEAVERAQLMGLTSQVD